MPYNSQYKILEVYDNVIDIIRVSSDKNEAIRNIKINENNLDKKVILNIVNTYYYHNDDNRKKRN